MIYKHTQAKLEGEFSRHPFKYYFEFSRDEDPSKPFEQVVIDGSGRARRRAVFGDEGDWDQDDDTVDMSDDEEEKNGASTDDGVSDDDGEDMEKFEIGDKDDADSNSDTGSDVEDVVLRDEDGQSFEGDSDDNDGDDDDDNDYNIDEVDVDNAEEEEEEEEEEEIEREEDEEDEEIVFNLKSQKHTGKQKLSKQQTTPIERTKKSSLSNKLEDNSEGESGEDEEEERNGKWSKNSVEHSDSESEVQFKKGKRKLKHDLNEGNIDDRRVKKKLKEETHSLEHKPIKDLLSSRKNGAKPKSTKGIGRERSKDTSEKKSSTQSKVKDGKELVDGTDDSSESEGMEDMDEEFDDEDDAGLEESSLASEEGIALVNCIVRSNIQTGFSDICVCSLTQPL